MLILNAAIITEIRARKNHRLLISVHLLHNEWGLHAGGLSSQSSFAQVTYWNSLNG